MFFYFGKKMITISVPANRTLDRAWGEWFDRGTLAMKHEEFLLNLQNPWKADLRVHVWNPGAPVATRWWRQKNSWRPTSLAYAVANDRDLVLNRAEVKTHTWRSLMAHCGLRQRCLLPNLNLTTWIWSLDPQCTQQTGTHIFKKPTV